MVENYKTTKICPVCFGTDKVYRSRAKNSFEKFINSTKILSFYRCHECGWRGIRLRKLHLSIKLTNIIKYILILFISYFVVILILKQIFKITYFK